MTTKRGRRTKAPYADEAKVFCDAILRARLSPREIAYRFGRSEDKIREMMEGLVKPDLVILRSIKG